MMVSYWKKIVTALSFVSVGAVMVYIDVGVIHTQSSVLINIGCSLLASGLVVLLSTVLNESPDELEKWKLTKIYPTRSAKNLDSPDELKDARVIDAVAFGLSSFREKHKEVIQERVKRGALIRILTMNPHSPFVVQRALEENVSEEHIKLTIEQLVDWANELNKIRPKSVVVKCYSCMTLDFYWRVDDVLCIGPYWYGMSSQQTVTYRFNKGGKGFELYSQYFERLWNDTSMTTLTR